MLGSFEMNVGYFPTQLPPLTAYYCKSVIDLFQLLCFVAAISALLSDKRQPSGPRPDRERQAKQIDEGLTESEEESARQTLLGQETCEVTGYEMRVREVADSRDILHLITGF